MLKAYYKISKYGKDEKLIRKGRKLISRSFLKQFICSLYENASNVDVVSNDILNNSRTLNYYQAPPFFCNGGAGGSYQWIAYGQDGTAGYKISDTIGIILGTGDTAVTPSDYKLVTPIVHGTTTGTMEYLGHWFSSTVTVSAPNASFTMERMYKNSSGGTITVKEIGIYSFDENFVFCICRDVLSSSVSVSDGEYLKVTYTIQVTV